MDAELVSSPQPCLTQGKLREIMEWANLYECRVVLRGKRAGECIGEEFGFPVILLSVKHARHHEIGKILGEGEGI